MSQCRRVQLVYIEPVSYLVKAPKDSKRSSASYFFDKAIAENKEELKRVKFDAAKIEKIRKLLREDRKEKEELLSEVFSEKSLARKISELINDEYEPLEENLPDSIFGGRLYAFKGQRSLIFRTTENSFVIIGDSESTVNETYKSINKKFEEANEYSKDFNVELARILKGVDFVKTSVSEKEGVKEVKELDSKTDQEKQLSKSVKSVTGGFIPNANVKFSKPLEEFEYDIIVSLGTDSVFDIEAKDYSMIKGEITQNHIKDTIKNRLILSTQDKAKRLGATLIIVVNDFPKDTLIQFKDLAESRDIKLFTEAEFGSQIGYILFSEILKFEMEPYWRDVGGRVSSNIIRTRFRI